MTTLCRAGVSREQLGDTARVQQIADEMSKSILTQHRAYSGAIRAGIALAQGDSDSAIELAGAALQVADLWLVRFVRANAYLEAGQHAEAMAELEQLQQRTGEAIAVFLNDRPTLRMMRRLDAALAATASGRGATSS